MIPLGEGISGPPAKRSTPRYDVAEILMLAASVVVIAAIVFVL
jgi:hypothetical protein